MKKLLLLITFILSGCTQQISSELLEIYGKECVKNEGIKYINLIDTIGADVPYSIIYCKDGAKFDINYKEGKYVRNK